MYIIQWGYSGRYLKVQVWLHFPPWSDCVLRHDVLGLGRAKKILGVFPNFKILTILVFVFFEISSSCILIPVQVSKTDSRQWRGRGVPCSSLRTLPAPVIPFLKPRWGGWKSQFLSQKITPGYFNGGVIPPAGQGSRWGRGKGWGVLLSPTPCELVPKEAGWQLRGCGRKEITICGW